MELQESLGYVAAIAMGFVLGLIGGGGSILTVPILFYLFKIEDLTIATSYSLLIVGSSALIGSFRYMFKGLVDFRTALLFGSPSIIAVFFTRKWIMPALPDEFFTMGNLIITKNIFLLLFFALLMIAVAYTMIRKNKPVTSKVHKIGVDNAYILLFIEGILVGMVTGLVGAGGGFLIVPALILFAGLDMKLAVGTSLVIIAAKSLIGFTGDLSTDIHPDWTFLLIFSSFAILGIWIGVFASRFVSAEKLKPAFGWFILIMGFYMIIDELI